MILLYCFNIGTAHGNAAKQATPSRRRDTENLQPHYSKDNTDIENTRRVSFDIKFTRQGFENVVEIARLA